MKANELCQRLKSNSAPLIVDARKTVLFKESLSFLKTSSVAILQWG
jgi:hypothetical protein